MLTNQAAANGSPRRPQSINSYSVTGLAISPYEGDLAFLRRMFDDASWKLFTARTYQEAMTQLHCCPAKSRIDSTGCRGPVNRTGSRMLGEPVKWELFQKA